jgi:thiamine-monophosphate kinase
MLGNGIEAFDLRDDAAVLAMPHGGPLVVSVDSVVEGVHVDLSICSPGDVGWKALMGALSDLAAVGATPVGALVALCVPGGSGDGELALGVMAGVAEASAASGCPVVGGDVSESDQLVVAVTVLGSVEPDGPPPVARGGAEPGDVLLLTGPCGGSAAGLRTLRARGGTGRDVGPDVHPVSEAYRRPVARVREGQLSRAAGAHAMIDVSDGLALDLHRLADASGVGFELTAIPIAPTATQEEALGGGEDYELVIALEARHWEQLVAAYSAGDLRAPIAFGTITAQSSTRTLGGRPLQRLGWQHTVG